jgi:hypothetical protein
VEKSITLCKDTLGWFFALRRSGQATSAWSETHPTSSADPFPHHSTAMTLPPHLAFLALKRRPAARGKRAPRVTSIGGSFSRRPELPSVAESVAPAGCPLVLQAARVPLAALYGGATSVIRRGPPFQMGQKLWGRLCRRPGAASKRGYPMSDRQWSPFHQSGVQPPRKAQFLQGGCESCLCPQTHHVDDARQLAPKVSIVSPGRRSGRPPPAIGVQCALDLSLPAMSQNEP